MENDIALKLEKIIEDAKKKGGNMFTDLVEIHFLEIEKVKK